MKIDLKYIIGFLVTTLYAILTWSLITLINVKGNVLKYVARYKFKGEPLEDLQKANWYLNRLIKEVSNGTS